MTTAITHDNQIFGSFNYIKPTDIKYTSINNDPNHNIVKVYPIERNLANTIGSSIRRTLINLIPGQAIIGLKLNDIPSQYSNIAECKEDTIDIIQNIKKLKLRHTDNEVFKKLDIEIQGPCTVDGLFIANELKKNNYNTVEVIDYSLHIMTINSKTNIKLSILSHKSYGYMPADDPNSWSEEIKSILSQNPDYMPIDAIFSPIPLVSYQVKDYYLNNGKLCDKLEISIKTNGIISCKDAIIYAFNFLANQMLYVNQIQNTEVIEKMNNKLDIDFNPILLELVSNAGFSSTRAQNGFSHLKIKYIGDLVIRSESYLSQAPSVGAITIDAIKERLKELNLELNMYVKSWPVPNVNELRQKYLPEITSYMMELEHKNNKGN